MHSLINAVKNKQIHTAILMIDLGHEIGECDQDFNTILHYIAKYNLVELANIIAEKDKDNKSLRSIINQFNMKEETPLSLAVKNGSDKMISFLIQHGAAVNDRFSQPHLAPISIAIKHNNIFALKELVKNKTNTGIIDVEGDPLLFVAAKSGCLLKTFLFLESIGADFQYINQDGYSLLHKISGIHDIETLDYLFIKSWNYLNQKNILGNTPLHEAVKSNEPFYADFLLQKGADIRACNTKKQTPLHIAVAFNRPLIIETLYKADPCLNRYDSDGLKPIHRAAYTGCINALQALLENGGNIEERDKAGRTPLFYAILDFSENLTKFLLESGANIKALNNYNETPLFYAIQYESVELLEMIYEHCINNGMSTKEFAKIINQKSLSGMTVLHKMAIQKKLTPLKFLIKHGADVNSKDKKNRTPLLYAIKQKHSEYSGQLINKCSITQEDIKDYKHFFYLSKCIVDFLLESGAMPDIVDIDGNNTLHFAAKYNNIVVFELLHEKFPELREVKNKKDELPLDLIEYKYKRLLNLKNK